MTRLHVLVVLLLALTANNPWAVASHGSNTEAGARIADVAQRKASEPDLVGRWFEAVRSHRPGASDPPVQFLGSLGAADLEALFPHVVTLASLTAVAQGAQQSAPAGLIRPNSERERLARDARTRLSNRERESLGVLVGRISNRDRFLILGATAHADAAAYVRDQPVRRDSTPPLTSFRFLRPRYVTPLSDRKDETRMAIDGLHWQTARWLLTFVSARREAADFVKEWYSVTTSYLARDLNYPELESHLGQALLLQPDDPETLYASGWLEEMLASPSVQAGLPSALKASASAASVGPSMRGDVSAHLTRAQRYLSEAVERAPDFVEARIRLGRTLGRRSQHAGAANHLRRALEQSRDPATTFRALLFLGAVEEARGRVGDAREVYSQALGLFPSAASVRSSLSLLEHRVGNREAALEVLAINRERDDDALTDPWWTYHVGPGQNAEAALSRFWSRVSEWAP